MNNQEEKFDSDNQYGPLAGRLTPYMAEDGIVEDPKDEVDLTQLPGALPPSLATQAPTQRPLPGIPPDATQAALQSFQGRQMAGMNKYGPEEQMATRKALTKANSGFLPSLARAGGGFADAIMQGVARAGPSNFQQGITNQHNKTMDDTMSTLKDAQTGKMAQIQTETKMSMDDPTSPMSQVAKNAQRPTLLKLGWTDEQINQVSGNTAEEAAKSGLGFAEIQSKEKLAEATLEQTGTYQSGMLGLKGKEEERANKELGFKEDTEAAKHWIRHPINAVKASNRLSEGSNTAGHGIPDLGGTFNNEKVVGVKKIK